PHHFNNYHEPFVGGASVLLYLKKLGHLNKEIFLNDSNLEVINAYQLLRASPNELLRILSEYKNEESFYYYIRSSNPSNNVEKAAKFFYLNRTSFNGLYRENLKGEYNVPYGRRNLSILFEIDRFKEFSESLQTINLTSFDFENTIHSIKKDDLVFLDPPYTVAHNNNGFIKYNKKIFSWEDQERLCSFIKKIKEIGAYFILTNAFHSSIIDLYGEIGKMDKLSRASTIGGIRAKRNKYTEAIFHNIK
ncbi:MAG: Dam family site-specific DNA-(adenine-N6)-methyltransferase, partial [Rikenellaceae bacterium]|nr:Dam family site-specific DNA-(adenine-N6)-methyltransferase [Rikenellaceae bacterium]